MANWSAADIPDQTGRVVLVTGANSGLGLTSAVTLAGRGARVLLACRSAERGKVALDTVAHTASTKPELLTLDLADLHSVRRAAAGVRELTGDRLDILLNNAGVMGVPLRRTADGFESQIGTNHLGPAALTWLLMPALRGASAPRVVTVSSLAHRGNGLDVEDLNFERRTYRANAAYSQSKLANLLFAFELGRRAKADGSDLISVAAHPGLTDTELAANMARQRHSALMVAATRAFNLLFTQNVRRGTLPQLYAATMPEVRSGDYFGPSGPGEMWGSVKPVGTIRAARNETLAARLWEVTAELTGVTPDPA